VDLVVDHIEIIRRKYKRHEGWLAPFPWCEDFQFQLSDIYTRLRMVNREKKARATAEQKVVETTEIFNPHEECKQPRKVLIEGMPGMGKTTYCNKVAYDWAINIKKEGDCCPEFEMVLLLRCRDVEIEFDLWEAIDDQLLPSEIQREEREKFFEFIQQNQSKVLLILDGLDELPSSKLTDFTDIIQDNMYFEDKKLAKKDADLPGFGFLSAQPGSSKRRPCMCYGFTHKSFQEFFAAHCLCCQLVSKETSPEILVTDTRYFGELREVLTFTCGLLAVRSKEIAEALIISIAKKLNNENVRECLPVAVDCIKESKIESSNFHMELARTFGTCLALQHGGIISEGLDDAATAVIAAVLEANTTLTNLHLSINNIGPVGAESLATALKTNTTLTNLDLSYNNLGPAGAESLATALKTNTTLTNLDLFHNNLGPAGAESLATALKTNTTLTNLHLSYNDLGPAGAESLATALKTNTTLTNLHLSYSDLGPAGAESLATALKTNTTLTNLHLSYNDLGPAGAESLATALKTNTTLTNLRLSDNDLGPAGAESLATALKTNTTLTNLDLSINNIGPAGAESLATALKTNTTLTNLDLSLNNVGPAGAESLATALKTNTTLTNLNLSLNNVGSAGAESLATALKTNTTLTNLNCVW
ncbi:unnamed protein product, partial [Porites lobata]